MLGTRALARLLAHVQQARGSLVLVGDHHQLPELDAGGAFAALAHRLDPITLQTNHRQAAAWEVRALDELRTGDVPTALRQYDAHDRLVVSPTADAQKSALVAAWWTRQQTDPPAPHDGGASGRTTNGARDWASRVASDPAPVVMLAARRADVADLNTRARTLMASRRAPVRTRAARRPRRRPAGAGRRQREHAQLRRRRPRHRPGQPLPRRDPQRTDRPRRRRPPAHAAAWSCAPPSATSPSARRSSPPAASTTATRSPSTKPKDSPPAPRCSSAADHLYREAGYVALSRGRTHNAIYLADQPDNLTHCAELPHAPPREGPDNRDPHAALTRALDTGRAQTMASGLLNAPGSGTTNSARTQDRSDRCAPSGRTGPGQPRQAVGDLPHWSPPLGGASLARRTPRDQLPRL